MNPPPPGYVWIWGSLKGGWLTVAEKPGASPVVRSAADPFHMPAKRNPPLSADRPAVVAAGNVIRSIRGAKP